MYMPPPRDGEEEAERIAGFWSVYVLSKMLGVALESPSAVCGTFETPGMCIDTPWPFDVDDGEQKVMPAEIKGSYTIRSFLIGSAPPSTFSYFAMSIQAAVLLHRATHLSGTWSPSTCFSFSLYSIVLISLKACNHETIKITQTSFNQHITSLMSFGRPCLLWPLPRRCPPQSRLMAKITTSGRCY